MVVVGGGNLCIKLSWERKAHRLKKGNSVFWPQLGRLLEVKKGGLRGHSLGVEAPPPLKLCGWSMCSAHPGRAGGGGGEQSRWVKLGPLTERKRREG